MSKHLFPVAGAFVSGVPAVEQDVDDDVAKHLLGHNPPAFSLEGPAPKVPRKRKAKKAAPIPAPIPEPAAEPAALIPSKE
jgi:hypothetical protein